MGFAFNRTGRACPAGRSTHGAWQFLEFDSSGARIPDGRACRSRIGVYAASMVFSFSRRRQANQEGRGAGRVIPCALTRSKSINNRESRSRPIAVNSALFLRMRDGGGRGAVNSTLQGAKAFKFRCLCAPSQ